jgi:hypothetical protein
MSRRKSLGDLVIPGSVFLKRKGRSIELCDAIPIPGDSTLPLHRFGDYYMFADESYLSAAVRYLSSTDSDYAVSTAIHFAIDENLKHERTMSAFDLPPRYKNSAAQTVLANTTHTVLSELKSRVHYVVASIRTTTNYPSEFAVFDHATNEFVALKRVNNDSISELNAVLQMAKETKRLLIMPLDSMALASSHMCTLVIEPKPKNSAIVHIFDPNGQIPSKEPDLPFMRSYKAALESSFLVFFSDFQNVFDNVSVHFHTIPNFNLPGAAPRNGTTYGPIEKKFLAHQLDRDVYKFFYNREGEGICAIVSLFIMVQTICFGRRVLNDRFWIETFRLMSGSPLKSGAVVSGLNRNESIFGGREVLHQAYMRMIYMRSLAWALYRLALPHKDYVAMGGSSEMVLFHMSGVVTNPLTHAKN